MTSINQYSVSLSLEAGGLFTGATLARGHLQKLNRVVRELQTPVETIEDKINFFTQALDKLGTKTDQQREIENRLYQELEKRNGGEARRLELMRQEEEQFKKMVAQEQHAAEITERHRSVIVKANEARDQAVRTAREHWIAGRIGIDVLKEEIAYQDKLRDSIRKKHDPAFIADQKKQTDALEQHIKAEREAMSLEEKHLSITERFAAAKANLDRIRSESLGALKDATYTKELIALEKTRDDALLAADPVHQQALKDQAAEKQRQIGMEKEIIALTEKHRSADEVYAATKHRLDQLLAHDASFAIAYTNELMQAERTRDDRLKAEDPAHQKRLQDELDAKEKQKKAEADLGRLRETLSTAEQRHAERRASYYALTEKFVLGGLSKQEYKDLVAKSEATMRSETADKSAIAAQEKLNSVINRHRTELQKLKADLALLVSAQRNVIGSDEQLASAINNVNNKIKEEEDRLSKLNNKTSETSGIVSGLTNRFAGFMAAKFTVSSITNLITQADQANIELSRTEAILGAISGSKFAGNQLIADLRQLTRQMPITLKDAAEGAKNLIAYGMSSREVIPVIRALGAITGGNTERFKNLANAVAQMRGANRLMGQEVIQAVNAGWNPLAEISRNTGKSILVLKKEMEEGKLGFDLVTQALQTATTGMGRFANVANDVMNTVAGKAQMLSARWDESLQKMGKAIEPLSISFKEFSTFAVERIGVFADSVSGLATLIAEKFGAGSKTGAGTISEFLFGRESAFNTVTAMMDIAQFDMLGGDKGEAFGQKDGKSNRADAIKQMSESVRLMEVVGRLQADWATRQNLSNIHIAAYNMYLKRQTEEKEKQKRIADAEAEKEKKKQQISIEQIKAKEKADEKFETMMNKIKVQTEELTRGKVAADTMKADLAGMTAEQQKQVSLASQQLQLAKAKTEAEKAAAKEQERFKSIIERYTKKNETDRETAQREISDVERQFRLNRMSLAQRDQLQGRIALEAAGKIVKPETVMPKMIDAFSEEGAKLVREIQSGAEADRKKIEAARDLILKGQKDALDQIVKNTSNTTMIGVAK